MSKSTQFKINELVIVTKGGPIDISVIYEEINIFDSLFLPVMSGNILIRDSAGLSGSLLFDGSESILIDIAKDSNSDIGSFRKAFRIYKQSTRKNDGLNSELYLLHFCSDELMYSDQQRVNQSYDNTYGKVVEKILEDYLGVPSGESDGIFEDTVGIRNVVIPNLRPIEAIEWCAKRSLDRKVSEAILAYRISRKLSKDKILELLLISHSLALYFCIIPGATSINSPR